MARSLELKTNNPSYSRQLRFTSIAGLVTTLIAFIVIAQNYYKYAAIVDGYSVKLSLVYNLIVYAAFALTTPFILKLADKIRLNEGKWYGCLLIHLCISIALALIYMLFCNLLLFTIDLSSAPVFPRFITKYLTNVIHIHLMIYWAIVLLFNYYKDLYPTQKAGQSSPLDLLNRFTVKENGRIFYLEFEEVYWIEAQDHYQKLHTLKGKYLIKDSMKNLEETLPKDTFRRTHRSCFVNINHLKARIRKANGDFLELTNGTTLKLGKSYRQHFKD